MRGFSIPELLIIIAISMIFVVAVPPLYTSLQVKAQLNESTTQVVQTLRTAREYSVARLNDSAHGVFFDINLIGDDNYILYQGNSYVARDTDYDREFELGSSLSFINIDFTQTGANVDINFSKGLGVSNNTGSLTIYHTVNGSKTVSVNQIGKIEED